MLFPLRVRRVTGIDGLTASVVITDARGRSIHIYCEEEPLRREVARIWTPAEATALAQRIARLLTDDDAAAQLEDAGKAFERDNWYKTQS